MTGLSPLEKRYRRLIRAIRDEIPHAQSGRAPRWKALMQALQRVTDLQKIPPHRRPVGANAARAHAKQMRARLEEFRESAARGETTPATLAKAERDLTKLIEAADRTAQRQALVARPQECDCGASQLALVAHWERCASRA